MAGRACRLLRNESKKETPRTVFRPRRFYAKPLFRETIFVQSQKILGVDDEYMRDCLEVQMGEVVLVSGN
jgi:hypothetical protein